MEQIRKTRMPRIGLRILKSSLAVFLCFLFYSYVRTEGILFYSQLAALWCIQPHNENSRTKAWQRTVGTLTGALFGLFVLIADRIMIAAGLTGELSYSILVALTVIAVIYVTLLIRKRDASYFSCVVFLSIVVNHIGDANPYLFVFNRVLDTMIGITIGMVVNSLRLPYRKEKNILFVSGLDDTLLERGRNHKTLQISPYSMVQLNRMIADGAQFTVSTRRTPASLLDPLRGVNLKLPVIAMDGAVMYDITRHEYLHAYVISHETTHCLQKFLDGYGINYFLNLLLDNTLIIQYRELKNEAERAIYEQLHVSPYRNYTNGDLLDKGECVYMMLIDRTEKTQEIAAAMKKEPYADLLRMEVYPSEDYSGYSYLKVYNRNATRDHMIEYLKKETGIDRVVTFGSIQGKYDVLVHEYDYGRVVKTLKKMYEPLLWEKKKS